NSRRQGSEEDDHQRSSIWRSPDLSTDRRSPNRRPEWLSTSYLSKVVLHAEFDKTAVQDLCRLEPWRGGHGSWQGVGVPDKGRSAGVEQVVDIEVSLKPVPPNPEQLAGANVDLTQALAKHRKRLEDVECTRAGSQVPAQRTRGLRVDIRAGERHVRDDQRTWQMLIDGSKLDAGPWQLEGAVEAKTVLIRSVVGARPDFTRQLFRIVHHEALARRVIGLATVGRDSDVLNRISDAPAAAKRSPARQPCSDLDIEAVEVFRLCALLEAGELVLVDIVVGERHE